MATLSQTLQIILTAQDLASGGIKKVGDSLVELDGKIQGIAAPFSDLAEKILKLDAVLIGAAATIGVLSVKEAAKFETALSELQKALSENEGDARQYADTLKSLALEYGVNANELVLSAADYRRSGNEIAESLDLVKLSLDLVLAGGISAADATDLLRASLAGFQIDSSGTVAAATRIGDVLNYIADNSEASFSELGNGFRDIAPVAKLAGLSFEEVAAYLAVVIAVGNSGAEAANGLGVSFARLIGPTGEAAEVMKELGVRFDESGKPIGNVKAILESMIPSWDKLTESQKFNAAATIVGLDQAKRFIPLLDDWAKAQNLVAAATENATGKVGKEVEIALKTAEAQYSRTNEAIRQLAQTIGEQLLVSSTGAVGGILELATAFQKVIESGKLAPLFDLINAAAENLGATLRAVAGNLGAAFEDVDLSPLIDALESLGEQVQALFQRLFGEIDLTTVEGLTNFIQQLVNGFATLTAVTEGIIRSFEPLFDAIGRLIEQFSALDRESALDFGEALGSMKLLIDQGTALGSALLIIGKAGLDMADVIERAFGGVSVAINALQVTFDAVVLGFLSIQRAGLEAGLSLAEFSQKFAFTNAAKQSNQEAIEGFKARLGALEPVLDAVAANLDRNKTELSEGWTRATEGAGGATDELRARLAGTQRELDNLSGSAKDAARPVEDLGVELGKLEAVELPRFEYADDLSAPVDKLSDALGLAGVKVREYTNEQGQLVRSFEQVGEGTIKATGGLSIIETGFNKTSQAVDEAKKKSDDFLLKIEEIASNERIKTIEAKVSLDIARLETDAERVKSVFASIDTTIGSTGDLLGNLFGLFKDADPFEQLEIKEQIDLENKRRQEALDIQKKLAEAEIARIEAQTRQLDRGDPWIRIDGTGLAPQLEAFMFEILKAIRTQVSADFGNFLLGTA